MQTTAAITNTRYQKGYQQSAKHSYNTQNTSFAGVREGKN